MKIRTMRRWDYWIGIPLCLVLSVFDSALRIFRRGRKRTPEVKKILFIKLSELGALVLAYPLLAKIKTQYPLAQVYFLTFAQNKDIFEAFDKGPLPVSVLAVRESSLGVFLTDCARHIARLRRQRIDLVFDLEFFSRFTALLAYLCGAKIRVGFHRYTYEGLYRGNLFTHKVAYSPCQHMGKTYLSLACVLGAAEKNSPELPESAAEKEIFLPLYASRDASRQSMGQKLAALGISRHAKLFLLNPGEDMLPLRQWPLENFVALCRMILQDKDAIILVVGASGAFTKARSLCVSVGGTRCVNLTGQTSLDELMELLLHCRSLIANDGGLAHLAALTRTKTFVMFGPESPQVFAPLNENARIFYGQWPCSPCLSVFNHRESSCKENICLKAISPEQVYRAIKEHTTIS